MALARAFLRQDPDVMLIGEIRDQETAQVMSRAAITGHLVLSTLHTSDATAAVPRLRGSVAGGRCGRRPVGHRGAASRAPLVSPLQGSGPRTTPRPFG